LAPLDSGLRAILLDIEGTTTPIAFVYQTLFPYARHKLPQYLQARGRLPETETIFDRLRLEHAADVRTAVDVPRWVDTTVDARDDSIVRYVAWLMERDRKSTSLKELQGRIWEEGYQSGELVGAIFEDVAPALNRWGRQGLDVGIFSSGSVLAQKLLFRHSSAGDLTPLLRWHFDTTVGAKIDTASYRRIASAIELPPSTILFVSDVVQELDAARTAGMRTVLSLRPGNAAQPVGHGHPTIRTFDELTI
jgi:enolase-phosphatase E1